MIIAIWGGSYVYRCIDFLAAPGEAVDLRYVARGGVLHLRADSYALNLKTGDLRVERPKVTDPNNVVIAYADYIRAQGLPLLNAETRRVLVDVRNAYGTITRRANGQIDLLDYLPERKEPPTGIPFSVNVNRAKVKLVDLSGGDRWVQNVTGTGIVVDGFGDQWLASMDTQVEGVGSASASLQSLPNRGIVVHAVTDGLEVAGLLDRFKSTPEGRKLKPVQELSADRIRVTGPVSLFLPKERAFQLETELTATGENIRYGREYAASKASFDGHVSEAGAAGTVEAETSGMSASFEGSLRWANKTELGGRLVADATSSRATPRWLQRLIPKQMSFRNRAHLDGWVEYSPDSGARLDSSLTAGVVEAFGETISNAAVRLHYDPTRLRASIEKANWKGRPIDGFVDFGVKSKSLAGGLFAEKLDLKSALSRYGIAGVSGEADARAVLSGTTANPFVAFRANGPVIYAPPGRPKVDLGTVRIAGELANNRVSLNRLISNGPNGTVYATGTYGVKDKRLAMKVNAAGIDLSALQPGLDGVGRFTGNVSGTLNDPVAEGRLQAFGLEYEKQTLPVLLANVRATKDRLVARDLRAVRGGSEATGNLGIAWKSGALSGSLSARNLQLSDFLGEQYLGSVDIPDVRLGGTLKNPSATGNATAENVLAQGTVIEKASLHASLANRELRVSDLNVSALEGSLTGSASYHLDKKTGTAALQASNLALRRVLPSQAPSTALEGTVDGSLNASFNENGLVSGSGSGTLQNVALNGTKFGGGPWSVSAQGHDISGSAQVGLLDKFIELEDFHYNTQTKNIAGNVVLFNNRLQDLYTSIRPYMSSMPQRLEDLARTTDGALDANIAVSGPAADPNFDIQVLNAKELTLGGRPGGELSAQIARVGTQWAIRQLNWAGAPGLLTITGTVDQDGAVRLDGDLTGFDLSYLSLFDPGLVGLRGKADFSFLASGSSASPVIDATLRTAKDSGVGFGVAAAEQKPETELQIVLDTIHVEESRRSAAGGYTGGITAEGKFFYRGFEGDVVAQIPVTYPAKIPDDGEISATLTMPKTDLKEFAQFLTSLDEKKTQGSLQGKLEVHGVLNALRLTGNITAFADTLAFDDVLTTFTGAVASVDLTGNRVDLKMNATSSRGGTASVNYGLEPPELSRVVSMIGRGEFDELFSTVGRGAVQLNNFGYRQAVGEDGSATAEVTGNLDISGPLSRPTIEGPLALSKTSIVAPSTPTEAKLPAILPVDPRLNIPVRIAGTANFRTSTAELALSGDGLLAGTATAPDFNGLLRVQSGSIRLPTARIALEPGGTVRPLYRVDGAGNTTARLDVDLEGRTALTALRFGDTVERYEITLGVRGDLLSQGGLAMTATSDPPDLSQDRILALLGQVDTITGLAQDIGRSGFTEERIRNALAGFAVPIFLDPFTSKIASTLGLEYLNVEYNAFEGTSISFAKALGKGLILQGRRQISQPAFGENPRYDLRLTYRLPFRNRQLRRVVFSVGLDQDRPWKLAVEYGFRF